MSPIFRPDIKAGSMAKRAHSTTHRHRTRQHHRTLPDHKPLHFHIRVSIGEQEPFSELILVSDRCFIECRVKMASGSVWRVWIVWLSLSVTLSLGCERLQLLHDLSTKTLDKLDEMGGPFPWRCVRERVWLKTQPLKLVNLLEGLMTHEKMQVVHQTMRQTHEMYGMGLSSVLWPHKEVESFRLLLDGQLRELEECPSKSAPDARPKRKIAIDKYFRKLRSFLKQKKFADCAWEIIRAETRAYLQQILLIVAKSGKN